MSLAAETRAWWARVEGLFLRILDDAPVSPEGELDVEGALLVLEADLGRLFGAAGTSNGELTACSIGWATRRSRFLIALVRAAAYADDDARDRIRGAFPELATLWGRLGEIAEGTERVLVRAALLQLAKEWRGRDAGLG